MISPKVKLSEQDTTLKLSSNLFTSCRSFLSSYLLHLTLIELDETLRPFFELFEDEHLLSEIFPPT